MITPNFNIATFSIVDGGIWDPVNEFLTVEGEAYTIIARFPNSLFIVIKDNKEYWIEVIFLTEI